MQTRTERKNKNKKNERTNKQAFVMPGLSAWLLLVDVTGCVGRDRKWRQRLYRKIPKKKMSEKCLRNVWKSRDFGMFNHVIFFCIFLTNSQSRDFDTFNHVILWHYHVIFQKCLRSVWWHYHVIENHHFAAFSDFRFFLVKKNQKKNFRKIEKNCVITFCVTCSNMWWRTWYFRRFLGPDIFPRHFLTLFRHFWPKNVWKVSGNNP